MRANSGAGSGVSSSSMASPSVQPRLFAECSAKKTSSWVAAYLYRFERVAEFAQEVVVGGLFEIETVKDHKGSCTHSALQPERRVSTNSIRRIRNRLAAKEAEPVKGGSFVNLSAAAQVVVDALPIPEELLNAGLALRFAAPAGGIENQTHVAATRPCQGEKLDHPLINIGCNKCP